MERKLCVWKVEGSIMADSKPPASLRVNFVHLVVPIYVPKIEKKIVKWKMVNYFGLRNICYLFPFNSL